MKKKLKELLIKADENAAGKMIMDNKDAVDDIADYLLANGVIVPPCKVGDTVYYISRYYTGNWHIHECIVDEFTMYEMNAFISIVDKNKNTWIFGLNVADFGKNVFLSREEAEAALKGADDERN